MITFTTKYRPPLSARETLSALDGAWDGRYEICWQKGGIAIRNPKTRRETVAKHLGGTIESVKTFAVRLLSSDEGKPVAFDWEHLDKLPSDPFRQTALACLRAHEGEMVLSEPWGTIALTKDEQSALEACYVSELREVPYGFASVGAYAEELTVVPVARGWLSAVAEFSLLHPELMAADAAYDAPANQAGGIVAGLVRLGVPESAVSQREIHAPNSEDALVRIDVDKVAIEASQVHLAKAGPNWDLSLFGTACRLYPRGDHYELRIIDGHHPNAKVSVCLRMRADVRLARVEGAKPLGETKGARMVAEALG